ncbi:hypothetical protein [Nocardia veterana]|uniref:Uncharacterized protein n=1 Tax=Nocardia veterana TaxID=132249 RepID=A0A7X6RGF0_9NOCA|nr:hypothetical protein [Nocardia veterana]NKY85072.1 hypothetical protein [Nocardia veterana]
MFDPLADIDRALADRAGWTWFDDHLLYTCGVLDLLRRGELARMPVKSTRIRLDPGEVCIAEGPAQWYFWRSAGDGTWTRNNIYVAGSASFIAAAQLGNALVNQVRRQRAEAASRPRWIAERPGSVMISDRRIHLTNPDSVFPIAWSALETIDLTAPDRVVSRYGDRDGGLQLWQLHSPWAVLIFVVAAHLHFPNHPLLLSGRWLPAGFEDKCHLAGKKCPRVRDR